MEKDVADRRKTQVDEILDDSLRLSTGHFQINRRLDLLDCCCALAMMRVVSWSSLNKDSAGYGLVFAVCVEQEKHGRD